MSDISTADIIAIRERAMVDLFFFTKNILGYKLMRPHPHQEMCDHITQPRGKRKWLTLSPRGSYKSSLITIAHSLWQLIHNPDLRILIASETQRNSWKYAKEIKTHFEENERFRALFGNWVPGRGKTWRDNEFTVSPRKRIAKEPTVMSASLEKGPIVGMHYDCIILDDVVSTTNVNTAAQIEKTVEYYRLLLSILEPTGKLYINGTRYSVHDLYGHLLDEKNPDHEQFNILINKAIKDPTLPFDEPGNCLMPDILSPQFLIEQRKTQGQWIFAHQYLNEAFSDDLRVFAPKYLRLYQEGDQPGYLWHFMTIDAAMGQSKTGDYSAVIVVGVDIDDHWWVREAMNLRINLHALVGEIANVCEKYDCMSLAMENFLLENFIHKPLTEEFQKRELKLGIKTVKHNRTAKVVKIRSLQPRWERGMIHIKAEHVDLKDQFLFFPQVKFDDLLDAMKNLLETSFPPPALGEPTRIEKYERSDIPEKDKGIWAGGEKKLEEKRRTVRRLQRDGFYWPKL